MNFTVQPEKNRKHDVYQYFRAALPFRATSSDFHTCSTSKALVHTKISPRKEPAKWPAVKERAARRPGFLRLDSQGESSENYCANNSSGAVSASSGNDRTLALFSDIFRRYMGIRDDQLTTEYCHKPKPMKPYDHGLNITAAVRPFCEQNNFLLLCHQKKSSVAHLGDITSTVQALHCAPHFSPSCTNEDRIVQQNYQKPVDFVSRLQPAEHMNSYCQFQYDCGIAALGVRSSIAVPQPFIIDMSDCGSAFKQSQHKNSINQLPVISLRSSDVEVDGCATEIRQLCHQSRWPRFNCRRKWLRVCHSSRQRKPPAYSCKTVFTDIDKSASDVEQFDSDNDCNECDVRENESVLTDGKHAVPQFFSSFHDLATHHVEHDALWVNNYCSQLPLPSSLSSIQETCIPESFSFASSLFVSGKEIDSSDFYCTDSDESDCSELSPSSVYRTDDVLPEYLLPGLPCFHVPFTDNWVLEFSGCASPSLDSDFEVCFEEDSTYVPSDEAVCNYSVGVEEANNRWNEAYSFPADVLLTSPQRHNRMV